MTAYTICSDLWKSGNNGMLNRSPGNILVVKDKLRHSWPCGDTDDIAQEAEK